MNIQILSTELNHMNALDTRGNEIEVYTDYSQSELNTVIMMRTNGAEYFKLRGLQQSKIVDLIEDEDDEESLTTLVIRFLKLHYLDTEYSKYEETSYIHEDKIIEIKDFKLQEVSGYSQIFLRKLQNQLDKLALVNNNEIQRDAMYNTCTLQDAAYQIEQILTAHGDNTQQELISSIENKLHTIQDVARDIEEAGFTVEELQLSHKQAIQSAMELKINITTPFGSITRKEIKKYLKKEIENGTLDWSENTQHVIEYLPKLVDIDKVDINEIITEENKINIIRESISKRNKERNTRERYIKILKKLTNKELNKISNDLIFCDNIYKTWMRGDMVYIQYEKGDDEKIFLDYVTELMDRHNDDCCYNNETAKKFIKDVLNGKNDAY